MRVLDLGHGLTDRLAVSNLWLTNVGFNLELATHAVNEDVEVKLAHSGDDGLTGFFIGADLEGGVFFSKALNSRTQLLLVALGLGLDRHVDNRGWEGHRFENNRVARVAQSFTSGGVLESHNSHDVTGTHARDFFTLVGVHLVNLADALLAALHAVEHLSSGFENAGVDAQVGELAQVRVGHDLERKSGEGLRLFWLALNDDFFIVDLVAFDGTNVERGRQVANHGVEHGLNTLVLERGAAQNGVELVAQGCATNRSNQIGFSRLGTIKLKEQFSKLVICVSQGLDEQFATLSSFISQVCGDLFDCIVFTELGFTAPGQRLHADQVNHAHEVAFSANGDLQDQWGGVQSGNNHVHAALEFSTRAVQLVHEANAGDVVLVSLAPHGL
ncbi:unannotated protein [freshwater metagenome]|uniref:Unannotated protein n=1 Tax=freshwater metagenome TaxID=449393 RepID=A0A6J6HVF7_9ZZZZ